MNRRGFLGRLAGGLAAAALAVHAHFGSVIPVPQEPEIGISIRLIRAFDPTSDKFVARMDVLYGFGALYDGECAIKILS